MSDLGGGHVGGRAPCVAIAFFLFSGCAGVFGFDGTSESTGSHANGALRNPSTLPPVGDGYVVPPPWRQRHSNFGSDELIGAVVRATREVARLSPGGIAAVGDVSRRAGGGSVEHRSHQSGRDVDVFYYATTAGGQPEPPHAVMLHFDRLGRARRWSPPQGVKAPSSPVPDLRFDFRRNWQLVRALLRDPEVEVQWIFVERELGARLLQQGTAEGDDAGLLARASVIMRQPSDSEPHDDHMHVRVYCDPADRMFSCVDRSPERWWKKRWKYMRPPFGRGTNVNATSALLEMLRARVPASIPSTPVAS